ncbi:MAG: tyrosine-type recombinase/integrase [Aureliella sp.]
MRRRNKVPKYRLHRASGLAVVTINGKDHYLGRHNTQESKRAYERLINEWTSCGRSRTFGILSGATIAMVITDYLDHCESYYPKTSNSETCQSKIALRFLADYFDEPAAEFGPLKLKSVRDRMVQCTVKHSGRPYSRQYVNRLVSRICRMFRWAAENEIVGVDIYRALANVPGLKRGRTNAIEAPKVMPVDIEIVEKTLEHCTPVVADMVRLQLLAGMRPGEVCALTPAMINTRGSVWEAELPEHKTAWRGKQRLIFLGPQAQKIASPYLRRAPDEPLFSPKESELWRREKASASRVTPLNCGNRPGYSAKTRSGEKQIRAVGNCYTTASYGRAIRYACKKAFPLPDGATSAQIAEWKKKWWWAPNRLRHAAATKVRQQHGLEAAQVLLGHSSADVTQIYAEANREKGKEVAASFG